MRSGPAVRIGQDLWRTTWEGLSRRGGGVRESACVWVGRREKNEEFVKDVIFLDDLPGVEAFELQHRASRSTMTELFEILRRRSLVIVADVHTHPEDWVDLSWVDQAHPIEYRPGLLALVLPFYGRGPADLETTGVHIYRGDGRWRRLDARDVKRKILVGGI